MEEEEKSLKDYLLILQRRKYAILIPAFVLILLSVAITFLLPAVYRSEGTILIEQQHIPKDLIKSTVVSFADERINKIQQKLMTVDNLNKIIDKYQLYPDEKEELTASELAKIFRENTELELINADVIIDGRHKKATLAFKLSFNHNNPIIAQKITNEMMTLFLDSNVKTRTERAVETSKFLEEEAEKFKKEIQRLENQIAEYKEKYSDSLPELLPVNLATINRIEDQIQQSKLRETMLNERKISLQTQLSITNPLQIDPTTGKEVVAYNLPSLKAEYERLLGLYSESHPDVKAIKRQIDNFKDSEKTADTEKQDDKEGITNPIYLQLKSELDIANVELQSLLEQRKALMESLKALEVKVSQTHQVERGYYDLMRDLENHKEKYQELKAKHLEARLSQTLEEEQKAEKFSILEPARVPNKPEKPNRAKLLVLGFAFSLGCGIGTGYFFEIMDDSIRGYTALARLTGVEPLIVIPYIENQEDFNRQRKHKIQLIILSFILLVAAIIAVHIFYLPLDILVNKIQHQLTVL